MDKQPSVVAIDFGVAQLREDRLNRIVASTEPFVKLGAKIEWEYREDNNRYGCRALRLRGHVDVLAVLVCSYLAFALINHLAFFADKTAGIADLSFFVESGAVTDADDCASMVLVRDAVDGGAVRYRCPNDVALGMGFVSDPFVPWPSYTAGESKELGSALSALRENAAKPHRN